jgi:oligopeptide transport system ATP-binding protein
MANENENVILSCRDLTINFKSDVGYTQAVRGISFDLKKGETLCIVGESGSGKSVSCKTIMGILPGSAIISKGSIMYQGEDLTKISEQEFHRIRGNKIGMIFQDPLSALNPIIKIGKQISEAMLINKDRLKIYYEDLIINELSTYNTLVSKVEKSKQATKQYKQDLIEIKKLRQTKISDLESELDEIKKKYEAEKLDQASIKANLKSYKDEHIKLIDEEIKVEKDKALEKHNQTVETYKKLKEESKPLIAKAKSDLTQAKKKAKEETKKHKEECIKIYKDEEQKILACYPSDDELATKKNQAKAEYDAKIAELNKQKDEAINKIKKEHDISSSKINESVEKILSDYKIKEKEIHDSTLKTIEDLEAEKQAKLKENYYKNYCEKIKYTREYAKSRAISVMKEVGIPQPEKRYNQYPFEFSGGMRQRIVIAIALIANPEILICDEPTTALDVTIQAQILELINKLKEERHLSCIFITHDMGVVAEMADRIAVMYAGKIVEYGTVYDIFYDPRHPYTWALLSSIPDVDSSEKLEAIPGTPPDMNFPPVGDAFALRSKYAMAVDFKQMPPFFKVTDTHYAATWLLDPRAPKAEMPKIVSTRIKNCLKKAGVTYEQLRK